MHPTKDLPALLGLTRSQTVRFLRAHRDRLPRIKVGVTLYYSDQSVAELRPLVRPWLEQLRGKPDAASVRGLTNISRALGLKPHLALELLRTFEIPTRRGVTEEEINDLRSVIALFLEERERGMKRAAEARRGPRPSNLIPAVGERDRFGYSQHHVKRELAAERRLRRSQASERNCLCCGRAFMSEGPHNRMCAPCKA